jgi:hypothetical protein
MNANLSGNNLKNVDFTGSYLVGSNLADTNLEGTNLSKIQIDTDSLKGLPKFARDKYEKSFIIIDNVDKSKAQIIRSIEFPPEYYQTGMSILSHFGSVLRKKYPNQKVRIRLDQEDLKVTMTVYPLEGKPEVIEEALDEYGLVITGQMTPEDYTDDRQLLMQLRTELRVAQVRAEAQKDTIEYQRSDLSKLHKLLNTGLRHPPPIQNIINVKIAPQINLIQGGLNELKEQLPAGSDEADSVRELQDNIEHIEIMVSPEDVAKSSEMSKFRRFINDLGDEKSNLGKTIRGIKKGTDIARELAGTYNEIAQWCGLPQVPKPFTKK